MNEQIKKAFDQLKAGNDLKQNTLAFIMANGKKQDRTLSRRKYGLISVAACMIVLLGIGWSYLIPTAHICIDINPSLELTINGYDRVLSARGINDDGIRLLQPLHLLHLKYDDAINQIIESEITGTLLADSALMTITVVSKNQTNAAKMQQELEYCIPVNPNVSCYTASPEDLSKAHDSGLSMAKYRAYLALKELDPSITPEKIVNMTMREIREHMETAISEDDHCNSESQDFHGNHGYGQGNGQGQGQGQGYGYHRGSVSP